MKISITITTFLLIIIIIINNHQFKKNYSTPAYINDFNFNKQILIAELDNISLNKIKSKGIYTFMHVDSNKTFNDLCLDIKKNNNIAIINTTDYFNWGYKLKNSIILIENVNTNELKQLQNFNFPNRTLIFISLYKHINTVFIESKINGIITSKTTKREGFIKYKDFINIINHKENFPSNHISFKYTNHPDRKLLSIHYLLKSLYYGRYILLAFIFITFIMFISFRKNKILLSYYIFLPQLFSSLFGMIIFNDLNGILKSIIIIIISLLTGIFISFKKFSYKNVLLLIWYSNILLLMYFTFSQIYLYQSPIGFNNIFYGTRFYGWNNDLIGIFIGSLLGITYMKQISKKNNVIHILILVLFIYILCFSPVYGANIGGMLSCFCSIIICLNILESSNLNRLIYIFLSSFIFLILQKHFISYDIRQNFSTHFGIFIQLIRNKELLFVLKILYTKIKQIILFLIIPPLNIILLIEYRVIFKHNNIDFFNKLWRNIFFLISLSIIFLNDSGLLSAIIMLFYYIIPYILNKSINHSY